MSKFHLKCTDDGFTKKKPPPKEDDECPPPPSTPPEPVRIQRSFEHHEMSKYHVKCTEDEFNKKKPPPPPSPPPEPAKRSSLLDVVDKENRVCVCPMVANAVRSHLHMNIGMEEKRERINKQID